MTQPDEDINMLTDGLAATPQPVNTDNGPRPGIDPDDQPSQDPDWIPESDPE